MLSRCLPLLSACAVVVLAADLELLEPQPLVVDQTGSATVDLTFSNNSGKEMNVSLALGDFEHRLDGRSYALGATRTWSPPAKLPPGTTTVRLTVSRIWEAGASTAILKNGGADIPMRSADGGASPPASVLTAIRIPAAYNLQIDSPTPDSPEIHFAGNRALMGIRNSDPFNYRMAWKLQYRGNIVEGSSFVLNANSTAYIRIPPAASPGSRKNFPSAGILASGTLKDESVPARLILQPDFGTLVAQPVPPKEIAVKLRFSRWSATWQQFANALFVMALLLVGGIASLWVNSGMPNFRRALGLRRRMAELDAKVQGIDSSIESRWRVLLHSHMRAIHLELKSSTWFFPSFATALDRLSQTVDVLQRWVDLVYDVSLVMHRAGERLNLIPPTVLRQIEERSTRALTPMQSGFTKDAELVAMRAEVEAAGRLVDLTLAGAANPELESEIQERESRSATVIPDLLKSYPTEFGGLISTALQVNGKPLSPDQYVFRDTVSLKLELIRVYDERLQQIPATATVGVGGGGASTVPPARERLLNQGRRLAEYLMPDTHESLRLAVLFVDEMRQDIYADGALRTAIQTTPPGLTIAHEPKLLTSGVPVRLCLCFEREILNEAVARREWKCAWDFGDGSPQESGWEVWHNFQQPGQRTVAVTIQDIEGGPVTDAPLSRVVEVAPGASTQFSLAPETKLEAARLAIVLLLALFGLMATAQQQAQSLTFLEAVGAVIALGYAAGTIKDIITRADK